MLKYIAGNLGKTKQNSFLIEGPLRFLSMVKYKVNYQQGDIIYALSRFIRITDFFFLRHLMELIIDETHFRKQ